MPKRASNGDGGGKRGGGDTEVASGGGGYFKTLLTSGSGGETKKQTTDLLFRPPRFVQKGPLQSERFGSPLFTQPSDQQLPTVSVSSSSSSSSSWSLIWLDWIPYWTATGNLQDLIYNDILRFVLPTHATTHYLKFGLITGGQLAMLMYTIIFGLFTTTRQVDSDLEYFELFVVLVVAVFQILLLSAWFRYTIPYLKALQLDWMNPYIPGWNRDPMHVPLGMYTTSRRQARQGACQWELPARPQTPHSNIWRLDYDCKKRTNPSTTITEGDDPCWYFCWCPTAKQALQIVEQQQSQGGSSNNSNTNNGNTEDKYDDGPTWNPIPVPSNWTRQEGYDKPIYTNMKYPWPGKAHPPFAPPSSLDHNPTGIYRKRLTLPSDWSITDGSEYTLVLHGVESACYVYWNGEVVGFSKDSRLPCEFNVTKYMKMTEANSNHGNNGSSSNSQQHEIMVVVMRWSDGSYVEDQDQWWMAGIHRSVELIRRPPRADLLQYFYQATGDGQLSVQVYCRPQQDEEAQSSPDPISSPAKNTRVLARRQVTFALYGDSHAPSAMAITANQNSNDVNISDANSNGVNHGMNSWIAGPCLWEETVTMAPHVDTCHVSTRIARVKQWTAETPNLYTLIISLAYCTQDGVDDDGDDDDDDDDVSTEIMGNSTASSAATRGRRTPQTAKTTVVHLESCRVGFRTISIRRNPGQLCINDKPITVCGINRHEHDPDNGKVITVQSMIRDVCLLKQNNFNAVRTCHYPNASAFYRICDCYGLYVCDEANIETHGLKPMGRLAHDPGWENTFISRITRMIQRDYNHASIIYWSLGNEAGRGCNFVRARRVIQQMDNSRPICYESGGAVAEGTGRTELTDIVCSMYPSVPRTLDLATRSDDDRPVILCEYSHAMGNSNGNLHLYWKEIWNNQVPRLQGGFIWDMIDQGLRVPLNDKGDFYFAYGGDFGDTINDKQFCINGMFSPDREPHPAVAEIKFLQQPVVFVPLQAHSDAESLRVTVQRRQASIRLGVVNRYSFLDLSHISWSWHLISNRSVKPIRKENFDLSIVDDKEDTAEISLEDAISRVVQLEKTRPPGGNSFFLNIRGRLRSATLWADAGHVIVSQQFAVKFVFEDVDITTLKHVNMNEQTPPTLSTETTDDSTTIFRTNGKGERSPLASFDKHTGALLSYAPNGNNILQSSLVPNFTRAATDNDKGGMELVLDFMIPINGVKEVVRAFLGRSDFSYLSHWSFAGLSQEYPPTLRCTNLSVTESIAGKPFLVTADCEVIHVGWGTVIIDVAIAYTVYADGKIKVSQTVTPTDLLAKLPSLPRVGVCMSLLPELFAVNYYGRGPEENYPDRKSSSEMGLYETTPENMGYLKYIVPSENGSRSDCEWISFRAMDGAGLLVVADQNSFNCSALLHSAYDLENATHTCDLPLAKDGAAPIHVSIDHKIMGVAGDVSWYPCVYPQYLVKPFVSYEYSFHFCPLDKNGDAAIIARTVRRSEENR
ncbi:hypothetical protein ACA910_001766 [Epithemia clementina (nom. ined.)]